MTEQEARELLAAELIRHDRPADAMLVREKTGNFYDPEVNAILLAYEAGRRALSA